MEGGGSKLGFTFVHVKIDTKWSKESHDCLFEEWKEEGSGKVGHEANHNDWAPWRGDLSSVFSDVSHDELEGEAVSNNDSDLSDEDEDLGNHIREGELKSVLQVKEETIPGWAQERVACDSHIAESSLIEIVTNLLDAAEVALSTIYQALNGWIFTTHGFCFLGHVVENEFNKSDQSNNERSHGDGSWMMHVGTLETIADFGTGLLICVFSAVVEVVSSGTYNNDESTAVVNEGGEPQKSEEHVQTEVPVLFGPHQVFNLWGKGTWLDLIQGGNANISTEPDDNN